MLFRRLKFILKLLLPSVFFLFLVGVLQLISNARFVTAVTQFLQEKAVNAEVDVAAADSTINELRRRIDLYVKLIERTHLDEGMVVNRLFNGVMIDECDSLLFSSLYFSALNSLNYRELARLRWQSLEQNGQYGRWWRHPKCKELPPSRDMIIGMLIALAQEPPRYRKHLTGFFAHLASNAGFFGEGGFAVSYMTPGVGEIFRKFSLLQGLRYSELPASVRSGFSTNEWSVAMSKVGYRLHLTALQCWLEMELNERLFLKPRSAVRSLSGLTRAFTLRPLHEQRLEYVTQTLLERSPKNLFFKYLRIRAASALSPAIAVELMNELLAMPQFPVDRLPNDCDRNADYVWQRGDSELLPKRRTCRRIFSGVDFVWMGALLLDAVNSNGIPDQ